LKDYANGGGYHDKPYRRERAEEDGDRQRTGNLELFLGEDEFDSFQWSRVLVEPRAGGQKRGRDEGGMQQALTKKGNPLTKAGIRGEKKREHATKTKKNQRL